MSNIGEITSDLGFFFRNLFRNGSAWNVEEWRLLGSYAVWLL
jgi:hypothetical protein